MFCSILCACSGTIYATSQYTPFARHDVVEENKATLCVIYEKPHISLYTPALYYTRPQSILYVANTTFVDEFDEETSLVVPVTPYDPLLPYNRSMYAFNSAIYQIVFAPYIKTYLFLVPKEVRKGIRNVLSNILAPLRIILNILQGDVKNAGIECSRFIVNSTAGFLGFIDITEKDTPSSYRKVNLDDVFHTWGIPSGPFIVLPFIGGRTVRGTVALTLEGLIDPLQYIIPVPALFTSLSSVRIVSTGSQYWELFYMVEKTSVDPYLAQRELFWQYMQQRHAVRK